MYHQCCKNEKKIEYYDIKYKNIIIKYKCNYKICLFNKLYTLEKKEPIALLYFLLTYENWN